MARDDEEAVQAARKEPTCYCDHRFESSFPDETHDISRTPKTPNTYETFGAPQVQASEQDDRLFVMFHGYGNDEREMIRIIDAVYAAASARAWATPSSPCSTPPCSQAAARSSSGSPRAAICRIAWCSSIRTCSTAAILMSPSFKGEESTDLTGFDSPTRFLLLYGSRDRTIPPADQQTARRVLEATGRLEYREYPGMVQPSSTRRSATSAPSSVSSRFRTDRPVPLGPSTPPSDHPSHTSRTRHRPQSVSAARVAAVTRRGCVR